MTLSLGANVNHIVAGVLDVAYLDYGPQDGPPAILLHGFPYDANAFAASAQRLGESGVRCVVPWLRGYGATRFLSPETPRSGQQAALAADLLALMDALALPSAVLAGYDWGGRAACIAAALWPERVHGLVSCGTGYNIQDIRVAATPAAPEAEFRYWYQYYFHTERGRAGLALHRRAFCRFLWHLWSPAWRFDEGTFLRSAEAFDNPDFVAVVIHSYRHRYGLAGGDPHCDEIERHLADQPAIAVPSLVLTGDADGVAGPPSDPDADAPHFTGPYARHILPGIGHNLPQEAPTEFAEAILSLLG